MGKLNAKQVENFTEPGTYDDGDGLRLMVKASGSKSWVFRYQFQGKRRDMGLGSFPALSLKAARLVVADHRRTMANGTDPMAARDAERERQQEEQRQQAAKRVTFEALALEYLETHGAKWSESWRRDTWSEIRRYALPTLGKLPAAAIERDHVLRVLQPIWGKYPRTADRLRGRIEGILDAAKTKGLRDGENPARWRGHLENLLNKDDKKKARQPEHMPAMNWHDVPALMAQLSEMFERDAYALRLLILTGARAGMVRLATWDEFDLEAGVWSLSAERMKTREPFRVPLAAPVVELLASLPRTDGNPYLFPGVGHKTGAMHRNAFRNLLARFGHADVTPHGFRSTFRDWANECTHYPRQVCELALAHDTRDQTEGAYSRSDMLEKRRALMADWAAYATTAPAANVIQGDFKRAGEVG